MGVSLSITLSRGLPPVDLSAITDARLRLQSAAGTVSHLAASVVSATATTATIRHALTADSGLVAGTYRLWGEISTDGGASWYPTGETSLKVTA